MTSKSMVGSFVQDKPEQTDRINIKFELDFEAFKRHKKAILKLSPRFDLKTMTGSDSFRINYKFMVDYHGVIENLNAIMELCDDSDIVVNVNCHALENERILVYEVLKKLDATIEKVKQRTP